MVDVDESIAKPAEKCLLNRKTAQEMESTKQNKAVESAREKTLRRYNDRSRRHARECARALRKGDPLPSSLSSIVSSPRLPSQRLRYCICEHCHIPKAIAQFLPAGANDDYKSYCLHCLSDSNGAFDKMRWCYHGSHEALRHDFFFADQEPSDCNRCAKRKLIVTPSAVKTLDNEAVPPEYWKLIEKFNSKLEKLERLPCDVCNEVDSANPHPLAPLALDRRARPLPSGRFAVPSPISSRRFVLHLYVVSAINALLGLRLTTRDTLLGGNIKQKSRPGHALVSPTSSSAVALILIRCPRSAAASPELSAVATILRWRSGSSIGCFVFGVCYTNLYMVN